MGSVLRRTAVSEWSNGVQGNAGEIGTSGAAAADLQGAMIGQSGCMRALLHGRREYCNCSGQWALLALPREVTVHGNRVTFKMCGA